MGDYVLRICCSAMICGALGAISGSGKGIRKAVYGIFLAFMVISPLRQIELEGMLELPASCLAEGERISQSAAQAAADEISAVIKEELEAYILVKAESIGAEIRVDSIDLDPQTLEPARIALSGQISPYDRQLLADYLNLELGIGREQQLWNGKSW